MACRRAGVQAWDGPMQTKCSGSFFEKVSDVRSSEWFSNLAPEEDGRRDNHTWKLEIQGLN